VTISRQLIDADLADLVFSGKKFSTASRTPSVLRAWRSRSYRCAAAHRPCVLATYRLVFRMGAQTAAARTWQALRPPPGTSRPGPAAPPSAGSSGHAV